MEWIDSFRLSKLVASMEWLIVLLEYISQSIVMYSDIFIINVQWKVTENIWKSLGIISTNMQ